MFIKKSVLISAVTLSYILGTLSGATAGTEVYLNISKKFSQKIRIAVPYFTPVFSTSKEMKNTAAKSAEQLSNDLMLSGYFAPIIERAFVEENQADDAKRGKINFHEWKRIGADLVVKANYAEKGGRTLVRAAIYSINDGVKIFDKSYDESVAARRTLIHKLADDIVKTLTGEKGIAQTKVTFVHKNGRAKEICIMDYDGFGMKKLTHDGSISLYPKWSHDKKKLVYTSYINGRPQICLIDLRNNTR